MCGRFARESEILFNAFIQGILWQKEAWDTLGLSYVFLSCQGLEGACVIGFQPLHCVTCNVLHTHGPLLFVVSFGLIIIPFSFRTDMCFPAEELN